VLDLAKLFTLSRDLGFVTDLRGAILVSTRGSEGALGYSAGELVGLDLPQLDESGELRRLMEAKPARSRMNLGFRLRTRSGALLSVGALATSLRDEAGAPVGWFIAGQDLRGAVAEARGAQPILDALIDSIGAALWAFDHNGTVITWAKACERHFGLSREEVEGKLSVLRLFPSPAEFRRVVESVDRSGQFSGEIVLLGSDGMARPNQVSVTPLISGGLSVGYTCVSFDVGERKRIEELQRAYFEQVGEAIVVVDLSSLKVVDVNDQACRIYGYSREEFLKLDTSALRPPGAQPPDTEIATILEQKGFYESDLESGRRKDASSFPAALNIRVVSIGGKVFTVGLIRDLTAQRRAEEFQRVLFEQAGEAIVVVDLSTRRILDANARACELHGYAREEFLRLRIDDIVSADAETQAQVPVVARLLAEQNRYEGRRIHRRKDGSLFSCSLNLKTVVMDGRRLVIGIHRDLTEQLKAEEFHRVLFEQAGEGIVVVDHPTRKVLDANDKAAAMHGYTREEFLKLRVEDYAAPPSPNEVMDIGRILVERGYFEGRQIHRRKDGSLFPCSLNLKTLTGLDRRLIVGVHRDLTEELKAEEFFRVLFERATDALYLVRDEGLRVVEANEAACRMLGYTRDEFLKLAVVDLVPPPYRHRIAEFHESVRTGHGYRRDRRVLYRKDGTTVATDQAVSRVEISGKPYYIASCRDLTEQERVGRELEEAKSFLEHVQENASDGLALWDENGVYIAANQRCLEMLGVRREDVIGTTWMKRVGPERAEAFRPIWDRLMKGERVSMRSVLPRTGASPVTVDINSTLIVRGERRYVFSIMRDVSDQVKAEAELRRSREDLERHVAERTAQLRESEEKFRGAFAQGGIGMALVAPDGRFLQVNRSLCEMLGYDEAEMLATTFQNPTHPEDREKSFHLHRGMLEGGPTSARLEKRYLHRNGHVVWADLSTTLIRDAAGAPLYFVTSIQEISERKRAEEELRLSEARFRTIIESIPLPVTITRPDGTILYVNDAVARLFQLGPDGPRGRNAAQFYADPGDRLAMREMLLQAGSVANYELLMRRSNGDLFWTVVNLRMITFDGGPAILGSFVDIDERKRSEEALRESEVRFRAITEGVPVAVVIARATDGRILYANGTASESLGLDPGTAEGRSIRDFLARPRDREEIQGRLTRDGFVRDMELQFQKTDRTRFWGVTSLRLATYKGERAALGVFSDISARKKAEELLLRAHEELERRVVERTTELARANALLQEEIAERKRAENTLRVILEGTAAVTGGSFFRSLARHLASALNVSYALVVQGVGRPPRRARAIAFWNGSDFGGPLEYDLQGTPCEDVLQGEACCYSHDVQRLFPDCRILADLGVDSYLGVPIADSSGAVTGQLVVMDQRPVADEELKLSVLKIFAARAGVELERQLAEEALRESEERWRSLVANAPDFILTVDRAGLIQSINRTVPGMRVPDTIGKHVFEFVHPGTRTKVQDALDRVFKQGRSHAYESYAIGPNGTLAWYDTRVGPIKIGNEVVGATFIATDITERRNAEQRQMVQHEVTQVLAEAASLKEAVPRILWRVCEDLDWQVGILWKIDPVANVLRLVDSWYTPDTAAKDFVETSRPMTFAPGDGLPGRVWRERVTHWIPDVQKDVNFPRIPSAVRAGIHAAFAAPVEGPQGIFGVIEFLSTEYRQHDEPLLQVITTLGSQLGQFIERKRAEADLRFQKSLLESQSEAAIDGILVVSREGLMTSFNRRFSQMWEIPDDVLRSRTDERALQSVLDKLKEPKEFLDRVRYLYDHPDEESRDEIHLKDGRAFDRFSAPVKGPDGELYGRVWYFRDITGRKKTEENLRRAAAETRQMYENLKEAQAQLIRSEKLASIGMLVSGVAHEINNPLNVMYGNLQLLAEVSDVLLPLSVEGSKSRKIRGTVAKVAKFRGMIRDALKAARHAREIVQDFRNFARDTRTAELVDLNDCLEEAVTLIQRELRPGIRVVRKLGRIPQVRCLRGQMSQVFLNLLKNAGEAIEKRGTVTLRTQQQDGHVLVEVADTGRGMPEEVRRKLFEPFFTTKPVGKGLGLGLSISAMIVHNHNGSITVQSQPGKGSVFRVELPLPP
jgi:PAS domain S-box-containing protein